MMGEESLISIIMPAYNAEMTIAESIESVMSQTYSNWELIIVNDGSSDATCSIIQNYEYDKRVKLLNQENQGVSAARNSGLKVANGDYIAFLDSDDLWVEDKLERQLEYFLSSNRQDLGLVYTNYRSFKQSISNSYEWGGAITFSEGNDYYRLLAQNYIATLTVMIKSSVLEKVGGFNTKYFGTEDWDLWIRIAKYYSVGFLDEELAYYRVHSAGISKNKSKHFNEEYKVINDNVLKGKAIPLEVKSMSLLVWYAKMIKHELSTKQFRTAFQTCWQMLKVRPCILRNYLYLLQALFFSIRVSIKRGFNR